ncbi:hypothetical protein JZ751_023435 [Albula glossodonta]|uniref:TERF1-interacting nuclear factor 2 N-terminal domain-containing protein n=1 Tax=Albula glossodonta TaxID=121402 RepID=A0A8T2N248_9TELE|nr:hypothetical protein JZ751_023435 [Albula glossodonta]
MVTAMETESFPEKCNSDPSLPLSSLRLLVPPLRLAGAAMWHVMQQRDALQYGRMAEFVTLVTETVPDLLTSTQAAQLIQGLRNRLCRGDNSADTQTISAHVNRIQSPNGNDAEVRASQAHFQELLQTLLKDPADREHFFQEVFPVEYGPTYDTALQVLVWEFLCRLEQLLPVPSLLQTTSLLSAAPSGLEECLQCVSHQHQLKTLLQQHKCFGQLATNIGVPSMDECMISSLPLPPLAGVVISSEQTDSGCQSETVQNSITILSSSSFTKEVASECVIDSTDYAGVEVELRTSVGVSEGTGTEERAGCEGALIQGAEEAGRKGPGDEAPHPVSRVIENYGQEHSELNGAGERDEDDLQVQRKREDEGRGTSESSHTPQTSMMVNEATLPSRISTQKKIGADLLIPLKWLPESNNKETFATYHDFSSRKRNAAGAEDANHVAKQYLQRMQLLWTP